MPVLCCFWRRPAFARPTVLGTQTEGDAFLQATIEQLGLLELNELTVVIRLFMATICGGALGLERTRKRRAAGLRTYMLVCIGSTLVMLTAQYLANFFGLTDVGRMPAQVINGIGFLGVGTIMVTRHYRVKGLTTAAGLWAAACMGLAIGIGFYFGALLTCLVLLMVMLFADPLEASFARRVRRIHAYIVFENIEVLKPFLATLRGGGIDVTNVELLPSNSRNGIGLFCQLKFPPSISHQEAFSRVEKASGVLFAEEVDD